MLYPQKHDIYFVVWASVCYALCEVMMSVMRCLSMLWFARHDDVDHAMH